MGALSHLGTGGRERGWQEIAPYRKELLAPVAGSRGTSPATDHGSNTAPEGSTTIGPGSTLRGASGGSAPRRRHGQRVGTGTPRCRRSVRPGPGTHPACGNDVRVSFPSTSRERTAGASEIRHPVCTRVRATVCTSGRGCIRTASRKRSRSSRVRYLRPRAPTRLTVSCCTRHILLGEVFARQRRVLRSGLVGVDGGREGGC